MSETEEKRDLIDILQSFNRKERFFLLAQALKGGHKTRSFALSDEFRQLLKQEIDVDIPENGSESLFVGMDYHLNWIHASLVLSHFEDQADRQKYLNAKGAHKNSQEDVDLIVAFASEENSQRLYNLIMIEAKAYNSHGKSDGLSSFSLASESKQLNCKLTRLDKILSPCDHQYSDVRAYFLTMSNGNGYDPRTHIKLEGFRHIDLKLPSERLVLKQDRSIIRSGIKWKGKRVEDRRKVCPVRPEM